MQPMQHDAEILDQFTKQAEPFLRRHEHSNEALLELMAECSGASAHDRLLDVACGPGIVSCFFARRVAHVTGLDIVPAMIERAQRYQAEQGLKNIDWKLGSCTALPFAENAFDAVVTRFSFHHLTEPLAALREMQRVAKPGRTVVVMDVAPQPEAREGFDTWERLRDPSHTSAMTRVEMEALGAGAGLLLEGTAESQLEMGLGTLLASSFPKAGNAEKIRAMFDEELRQGTDRLGVAAARQADGRVRLLYPVVVMAWRKTA